MCGDSQLLVNLLAITARMRVSGMVTPRRCTDDLPTSRSLGFSWASSAASTSLSVMRFPEPVPLNARISIPFPRARETWVDRIPGLDALRRDDNRGRWEEASRDRRGGRERVA